MNLAFPHRTLPEDGPFKAGPWQLEINGAAGGEAGQGRKAVVGWDYNMDLELVRDLEIDGPGMAHSLGLPESTPVTLSVLASTGDGPFGRKRWVAFSKEFPMDGSAGALRVRLRPESGTLAGKLTLETLLTLAQDAGGTDILSPSRKASHLVSRDRVVFTLEGEGARLPMFSCEFPLEFERAPWRIVIDADATLDHPVTQSVQIQLNSRQQAIIDRLLGGQDPYLQDQVKVQFARLVAEFALQEEDRESGSLESRAGVPAESEEKTIAELAVGYITSAYPTGDGITSALREWKDDRPVFEARFDNCFRAIYP